jgi:hypothetical protein
MVIKKYKPEQIVTVLRQIEVRIAGFQADPAGDRRSIRSPRIGFTGSDCNVIGGYRTDLDWMGITAQELLSPAIDLSHLLTGEAAVLSTRDGDLLIAMLEIDDAPPHFEIRQEVGHG